MSALVHIVRENEDAAPEVAGAPLPAWKELLRNATLLSGDGGTYPCGAKLRELVCLLDVGEPNKVLLVADKKPNQHILAYEEMLRRNRVPFTRQPCTTTDVATHYAAATAVSSASTESINQGIVARYMRAGAIAGASDLMLVVGLQSCSVRLLIDGWMREIDDIPRDHGYDLIGTVFQGMLDAGPAQYSRHLPLHGRVASTFATSIGIFGARVQSTALDRGQLLVMRLLADNSTRPRTPAELGYSPHAVSQINAMRGRTSGINFFSGRTGSGKSTSLAAIMSAQIKATNNGRNVITAEDPVEYLIEGANQINVLNDDWAGALKVIMRLAPSYILVGEVRDRDSASGAISASMTGHQVWTTLHCNDVISSLQRLTDIGVDPGLLADPSIFTGFVNQSLARLLCSHCKKPWRTHRPTNNPALIERVEKHCDTHGVYVAGPGCAHCDQRTTRGRIPAAEAVIPTRGLLTAYQRGGKVDAWDYWTKRMHGETKTMHLIDRINAGLIDPAMGEADVDSLDHDELLAADDA